MVTITFPDPDTEKRALGFLLGRFSGRVLRSGEHLIPEAALEALADQNIPFTVKVSQLISGEEELRNVIFTGGAVRTFVTSAGRKHAMQAPLECLTLGYTIP